MTIKLDCAHLHVETYTTGGMHFSPVFGPYDDIHYYAHCTDCGETRCVDVEDWPYPYPLPVDDSADIEIPI